MDLRSFKNPCFCSYVVTSGSACVRLEPAWRVLQLLLAGKGSVGELFSWHFQQTIYNLAQKGSRFIHASRRQARAITWPDGCAK